MTNLFLKKCNVLYDRQELTCIAGLLGLFHQVPLAKMIIQPSESHHGHRTDHEFGYGLSDSPSRHTIPPRRKDNKNATCHRSESELRPSLSQQDSDCAR